LYQYEPCQIYSQKFAHGVVVVVVVLEVVDDVVELVELVVLDDELEVVVVDPGVP
jgi:hypothetical protein